MSPWMKFCEKRGVTEFQPKKDGLSLSLMDQGQTNNPKCKHNWLPNEILGLSWKGSYHSTHNRAKFSDWLIYQTCDFSLDKTLSLISQPIHGFSNQISTTYIPSTYKPNKHLTVLT